MGEFSEFDIRNPILTQSMISQYLHCGLQWEFRYIKGLKIPPKGVLTLGSAVDAGVTHNLSQKIETGIDLPIQEVESAFESDFERRAGFTDWSELSKDDSKDIGVQLVRAHHRLAAPLIKPKAVQWSFDYDTERGYRLAGTADLVDESDTVEDTKTAAKAYSEDAIGQSLQGPIYVQALSRELPQSAGNFRYRVLVKPTKTLPARVQTIDGRITDQQIDFANQSADRVHAAIQAGIALPADPKSYLCNEKFCGFFSICKGRKTS